MFVICQLLCDSFVAGHFEDKRFIIADNQSARRHPIVKYVRGEVVGIAVSVADKER